MKGTENLMAVAVRVLPLLEEKMPTVYRAVEFSLLLSFERALFLAEPGNFDGSSTFSLQKSLGG